jgi:hypothetical protein
MSGPGRWPSDEMTAIAPAKTGTGGEVIVLWGDLLGSTYRGQFIFRIRNK